MNIQFQASHDPVMLLTLANCSGFSVAEFMTNAVLSKPTKSSQLTVCSSEDQTQHMPAVIMAENGLTGAA